MTSLSLLHSVLVIHKSSWIIIIIMMTQFSDTGQRASSYKPTEGNSPQPVQGRGDGEPAPSWPSTPHPYFTVTLILYECLT